MSAITNTTISNYNYLLRNCYSSNRNARKAVYRTTFSKEELISADSNALKKIARNLKDLDYSAENGVNVYNNVKAFVESYNNLIESTSDSNSGKLERVQKNLKKLVKEYADELEEIGIKASASGGLKLDEKTLLSASPSKVSKVFSSSGSFTSNIRKYASSISHIAKTMLQTGTSKKQTTATVSLPGLTEAENIMTASSINIKA